MINDLLVTDYQERRHREAELGRLALQLARPHCPGSLRDRAQAALRSWLVASSVPAEGAEHYPLLWQWLC
jgi:hypothetical protein